MTSLIDAMKKLHADNFTFYLKAHKYHWNIEGPDFKQYHSFLEDIYTMAWEDADAIAEEIRALGYYSTGSLRVFSDTTSITEDELVPDGLSMLQIIYTDLQLVLNSIMEAYKAAEAENAIGLSNFLQDKYDARKKLSWMLRATLKR